MNQPEDIAVASRKLVCDECGRTVPIAPHYFNVAVPHVLPSVTHVNVLEPVRLPGVVDIVAFTGVVSV